MRWSCCLLLSTLAIACGTTPDDRPLTMEVVTFEVLKPTCGQVQCHSTTSWQRDLAFDTLDASRASLCHMGVAQSAMNNDLADVLDGNRDQMPPDLPLAKEDEALIFSWMKAGAPGLTPCPKPDPL